MAEPFAGPLIELAGDRIAVVLRELGHALFLGQVLADQAVGVFVGAAFPDVMGCRGSSLYCTVESAWIPV